jgi:hypothetical protein
MAAKPLYPSSVVPTDAKAPPRGGASALRGGLRPWFRATRSNNPGSQAPRFTVETPNAGGGPEWPGPLA